MSKNYKNSLNEKENKSINGQTNKDLEQTMFLPDLSALLYKKNISKTKRPFRRRISSTFFLNEDEREWIKRRVQAQEDMLSQQKKVKGKKELSTREKRQMIARVVSLLLLLALTVFMVLYINYSAKVDRVTGTKPTTTISSSSSGSLLVPEVVSPLPSQNLNSEEVVRPASVQVSQKISVAAGSHVATINLVNPPDNPYLLTFKLVLAEDETTILYLSDMLKPGEGVDQLTLDYAFEAGEHAVVGICSFYNEDGSFASEQTLNLQLVKEEEETVFAESIPRGK